MNYELDIRYAKELVESEKLDEALVLLIEITNERMNDALALFLMGLAFIKAGKLGLAYTIYRRVVELAPDRWEAWNNLGKCITLKKDIPEAENYFNRSIELNPKNAATWANLAVLEVNRCHPEKAIEYSNKSIELDPKQSNGYENRALANLLLGNFAQGWDDYTYMLGNNKSRKMKAFGPEPEWDGSKGKNIVIYGEQGIGDELSFASCIPDAIRDSESVIIECDKRLKALFTRSFPKAKVYGTRFQELVSWPNEQKIDASVAVGTLPMFYRRKKEDFHGTPYLIPDPERRIQWRALFDTLPGKKIGISWQGGSKHTDMENRSLTEKDFDPILSKNGYTFVNLQYNAPPSDPRIRHWTHGVATKDYDDTAAMVAELDLVITVQTAVVHLCGAIGKECWVMVPPLPRWFYMMEGSTVPWYKSIKMFRPDKQGRWPIQEIANRL